MATKKKGLLTTSKEWCRHFRKGLHRDFWKRERKAARAEIRRKAKRGKVVG